MRSLILSIVRTGILVAATGAGPAFASQPESLSVCLARPLSGKESSGGKLTTNKPVREGYSDHQSRHLNAMEEPDLPCTAEGELAIRFLWLRTFDRPVAVRLQGTAERMSVSWVELDGAGGYEPGNPSSRGSKQMSNREAHHLFERISRSSLLTAVERESRVGMRDGAEWVFEIAAAGKHRVVERLSPTGGEFRDLGILLLKQTTLAIPEDKLY